MRKIFDYCDVCGKELGEAKCFDSMSHINFIHLTERAGTNTTTLHLCDDCFKKVCGTLNVKKRIKV